MLRLFKIILELFLEVLRFAHMKAPSAVKKWYRRIGSKGGSANTEAQNAARKLNGAKGGRPRRVLTEQK